MSETIQEQPEDPESNAIAESDATEIPIAHTPTREEATPIYCARCCQTFGIPFEDSDSDADSDNRTDADDDSSDEDSVSPIFQEDPADVEERILEEIDEYFTHHPLILSHSNVEKEVTTAIANALIEEWSADELCEDEFDGPEIREWVRVMVDIYLNGQTVIPPRQGGAAAPMTPLRRASIARKLRPLDSILTPAQRTQEWYEERYNRITASNLWKALGSEAQQNQLIVEKCQSFEQFKEDSARQTGPQIGSDNPMAWGHKYEPVTAKIYERRNKTRLGEYGCITHPDWPFLGASPDGINADPESPVYGRMVEIKNIVNREITGVPLDHYWIQMQTQMEVCDLDECDFVETRFKEFASKDEFLVSDNPCRGVILGFSPHYNPFRVIDPNSGAKKLASFYEYHILGYDVDGADASSQQVERMDEWIKTVREKYEKEYVLAAVSYWALDQYSCVLVQRNRMWFEAAIPRIEAVWNIIKQERITGCQHRAPKKRPPKPITTTTSNAADNSGVIVINKLESSPDSGCLVKIDDYDAI